MVSKHEGTTARLSPANSIMTIIHHDPHHYSLSCYAGQNTYVVLASHVRSAFVRQPYNIATAQLGFRVQELPSGKIIQA